MSQKKATHITLPVIVATNYHVGLGWECTICGKRLFVEDIETHMEREHGLGNVEMSEERCVVTIQRTVELQVQPIVVNIRKRDGEYRVPGPERTEAAAYYTNDREDAIGTAKHMWGGRDIEIRVK